LLYFIRFVYQQRHRPILKQLKQTQLTSVDCCEDKILLLSILPTVQ